MACVLSSSGGRRATALGGAAQAEGEMGPSHLSNSGIGPTRGKARDVPSVAGEQPSADCQAEVVRNCARVLVMNQWTSCDAFQPRAESGRLGSFARSRSTAR